MRRVAAFVRTAILGGVVVVLPLWLTAILLLKAAAGAMALLAPVINELPSTMHLRRIAAIVIVVIVCFIAGVIVRTRPGRWAKSSADRYLERVPGYTLVRGLAGRITGQEEGVTFAAALVEIEEALVPAFVVERHPDGRFTVFVPSVPTPATGSIYILTPERVHFCDVPFTTAVSVFSKWGAGTQAMLDAMRPRSG